MRWPHFFDGNSLPNTTLVLWGKEFEFSGIETMPLKSNSQRIYVKVESITLLDVPEILTLTSALYKTCMLRENKHKIAKKFL